MPTWRIATPEGAFLILTRFDADKPGQRDIALFAVSRFMTWKMAISFVLTGDTRLGASGDEALLTVGVSYHERLAVMQRVRRGDADGFSDPMWLAPHHVDDRYFAMLPNGRTDITAAEEAELARLFGKHGVFRADRLN